MGYNSEEEAGRGTAETAPAPDQSPAEKDSEVMAKPQSTKAPAFQFYPKDFLTSTKVIRMSLAELGAYVKLLCVCWIDGSLPPDERTLATIVGTTAKQFSKMWANVLKECFTPRSGRLVHQRLEQERQKQTQFSQLQAEKAGKRWEKPRHAPGNAKSGIATALPERHSRGNALQSSSSSSSSNCNLQSAEQIQVLKTTLDRRPTKAKNSIEPLVPMDIWLRELQGKYPEQAVSAGHLTELAFVQLFESDPRTPENVWFELMDNLENQKRGKQWRVKGMIPKLEKWLREGLWKQRHEAYSASDLSEATQKAMAGAAAFLHEGKRDDSR